MITYEQLNDFEKEVIEETKVLVQKTLPLKEGITENDVYALFLRHTVEAINAYPPSTNFPLGAEPRFWRPALVLGCRLQAYKFLETYWTEVPDFGGLGIPYANRTAYMDRWAKLFDQLFPIFKKTVAQIKVHHFPGSSMVVSQYHPDVLLRGMWEWPRYWRY